MNTLITAPVEYFYRKQSRPKPVKVFTWVVKGEWSEVAEPEPGGQAKLGKVIKTGYRDRLNNQN